MSSSSPSSSPTKSSKANGSAIGARSGSSPTSSSPTSSTEKTTKAKVDLVFSSSVKYSVHRSRIRYEKLSSFIEEWLRYINTFNYPYTMTYNVNNETYEWHSAQEDIVQKIKELMESEKSEDIDSLTFTADKTGGIVTFAKYNVDFLLLILTVICFMWFLFFNTYVSKTSLHVVGAIFLFRLTRYVELPFANYFKSLFHKEKTE